MEPVRWRLRVAIGVEVGGVVSVIEGVVLEQAQAILILLSVKESAMVINRALVGIEAKLEGIHQM